MLYYITAYLRSLGINAKIIKDNYYIPSKRIRIGNIFGYIFIYHGQQRMRHYINSCQFIEEPVSNTKYLMINASTNRLLMRAKNIGDLLVEKFEIEYRLEK